jgi:hypothetical protein
MPTFEILVDAFKPFPPFLRITGFSDFVHCPVIYIETRQYVSVTESVSVLRLALYKGPNRVYFSPPHLRTKTDQISRIPDDGQSPKS